jgi:preprotein translocase subunit SecB
MAPIQQPSLTFFGVIFPNFGFAATRTVDKPNLPLDISIKPSVYYPPEVPGNFNIVMQIEIICKDYFEMSLAAIGQFRIPDENTPADIKKSFVNTNAPAIMFPYVRAFITTITSNVGNNIMGSIILNPYIFDQELPVLQKEEMYAKNPYIKGDSIPFREQSEMVTK